MALNNANLDDEGRYRGGSKCLQETPFDPEKFQASLERIPGFEKHKQVKDLKEFGEKINSLLEVFQASQPPDVINSEIYPVIYRLQVGKWAGIAEEHLRMIKSAIQQSFEGILQSVCPPAGGTAVLHKGLSERLDVMFSSTFHNALERTREYCKQEMERTMLHTTDPRFAERLRGWRMLRYARAHFDCRRAEANEAFAQESDRFTRVYEIMNGNAGGHMQFDIHDVVKVYYQVRTPML